MDKFYNIPDDTKAEILRTTGEKTNLPAYAVEKDWWVVQTLAILFETKIGKHMVFKGGTSLSKTWRVYFRRKYNWQISNYSLPNVYLLGDILANLS